MDVEFDAHILDNAATKQNLVKSTEFLENGNARKNSINCKSLVDIENQMKPNKNGQMLFGVNTNFDFPREAKRVSTSYVDRYFEQPKYFEDELTIECPGNNEKAAYFEDEKMEKYEKMNNFEQTGRSTFWSNFQDPSPTIGERLSGPLAGVGGGGGGQNKITNSEPTSLDGQTNEGSNIDTSKDKTTTSYESPRGKATKFDSPTEKMMSNFDSGTRPKIPVTLGDSAKFGMIELTKKFDLQKIRSSKVPFVPRNPSQEGKTGFNPTEALKTNLKNPNVPDSPRGNLESVRINIQSFRKVETNKNGHDNYPFVISNNPLFIAEPEKKDSPIYSSSESLRVNFQRLRRKSDAETNNQQVELSSKIFAEKYQREVSGLESVKNYLDSKKGQSFNLGLGKLTQNMIQLGKNIAQNSRNLESSVGANTIGTSMKNVEVTTTSSTPLRGLNVPAQKPNHLDLNIPLQSQQQKSLKLNLSQRSNLATSPSLHQHILEPPKLYQNENSRKDLTKTEVLMEKLQSSTNVYRHRTSSLSENRKPPLKNIRRSFHPGNESSEDSDSVSHSETDIRTRLRYKRRHKKVPHSLRLNLKNKPQFLHPDAARGFSAVELCGKSPPPSTSFLNSLSPPFSSRNNLLSWPESAPSSSLTFTSNSELDSDTSSEYPEFTNDILTFPPSPAP